MCQFCFGETAKSSPFEGNSEAAKFKATTEPLRLSHSLKKIALDLQGKNAFRVSPSVIIFTFFLKKHPTDAAMTGYAMHYDIWRRG